MVQSPILSTDPRAQVVEEWNSRSFHTRMAPPTDYGAPDRFNAWRFNQDRQFDYLLSSPERFVAACSPTGSGKSLVATLAADILASGKRAIILTHRIGLAHQYAVDFAELGMVEIHGRRNYRGRRAYNEALLRAWKAPLVVTTYAYYLAAENYGRGLDRHSVVVADEADEAFDALSSFFTVSLHQGLLEKWGLRWPGAMTDVNAWKEWAPGALNELDNIIARSGGVEALLEDQRDEYNNLVGQLNMLKRMEGDWVVDTNDDTAVDVAKVWPGSEALKYLFQPKVDKVLMLSATLRPKHLDQLGIPAGERAFQEWPHPFHEWVRPVYWFPTLVATVRASRAVGPGYWTKWYARIDQIINRFPDKLGIIHTVSYQRARDYMRLSMFSQGPMAQPGLLTTHSSRATSQAIESFRHRNPPSVLVSPVIISGWDLPEVGYQVIGKIPWPSRSNLRSAREKVDPDYTPLQVMRHLVQQSGRIVRGPNWEDRGITVLIDDTWKWFWKYTQPEFGFAPSWFRVRKVTTLAELR